MEIRLSGRRTVAVHAFPSLDTDFARAVADALVLASELTTDEDSIADDVSARLRETYPDVRVVRQGPFSQLTERRLTLYAYRDGRIGAASTAEAAGRTTVESKTASRPVSPVHPGRSR